MKNVHKKLANARAQFHQLELKKSGHNKFAGYKYFELADFVQPGMKCLADNDLVPVISFTETIASLILTDYETGEQLAITSPMSSAALKGCHEIQNLGAVQTYLRRYLWVALLEIIEHDALDSSQPVVEKLITKAQAKKLQDLVQSLPDDKAGTVTQWVAAKYGRIQSMPADAYDAVIKRLEAA
jgi:hypothetical protein